MSVLMETTYGSVVIDLYVQECPKLCFNFLKLCTIKYYNNNLIFNVQENYTFQSGDPTGTGAGGKSFESILKGGSNIYVKDEFHKSLIHDKRGTVSMANAGKDKNGSQFFVNTSEEALSELDGKYCVFGQVVEGFDVLEKIDQVYVDAKHRPYIDARILHTFVLDDPFSADIAMDIPDSPIGVKPEQESVPERLSLEEAENDDKTGKTEEEIQRLLDKKEENSRAVVLEMIGDLPDADVKPPEEVLFICKLNHVTTSEDLELIFSRFGPCKCHIIKDFKTKDSLCFGFVEFTKREHCEEAYFKMNNVLIDDRRIKVDFSQSVSKLWNQVTRRPFDGDKINHLYQDKQENSSKRNAYKPSRKHHQNAATHDILLHPEDTELRVEKKRRRGGSNERTNRSQDRRSRRNYSPTRKDRFSERKHKSQHRSPKRRERYATSDTRR